MSNTEEIVGTLKIYRHFAVYGKTCCVFDQPVTAEQKAWRIQMSKKTMKREYVGSVFRRRK